MLPAWCIRAPSVAGVGGKEGKGKGRGEKGDEGNGEEREGEAEVFESRHPVFPLLGNFPMILVT